MSTSRNKANNKVFFFVCVDGDVICSVYRAGNTRSLVDQRNDGLNRRMWPNYELSSKVFMVLNVFF